MPTEEEYKNIAWEMIGSVPIGLLLQDCVDALVEGYKEDEEIYLKDKELLEEDDTTTEQYWVVQSIGYLYLVGVFELPTA